MTMMGGGDTLTQLGSTVAGIMFIWAMFKQYFPPELQGHIEKYAHKLISYVYPFIHITFYEYPGDGFERSKAYAAIQQYLSTNSTTRAKRLKADMMRDSRSITLSMDDYEEITDEFKGIKLWWASSKNIPKTQVFSIFGGGEEKRGSSSPTTGTSGGWGIGVRGSEGLCGATCCLSTRQRLLLWLWSLTRRRKLSNDLITFSKAKDYYKKVGKAWKRGYLLYGPPGTGKSTMIAAMANLLEYDVYDLELTAVKDNTDLRKLLIDTSSKSIIVIEDIDCSLDLTGQRKKEKDEKKEEEKDPIKEKMKDDNEKSKVTLSGLLNFIDGLWSACGSERIIVFTTNYVEKLDPALIRRGRMDKHIELSYCSFEAFKVLARNYLDLDSHELFAKIRVLLEETKTSPADVAENLMPKSAEEDADTCLANLIKAIEAAKEEARLKAEEEARLKAEEEEKLKAEKEEKEKEEKEKEKEKEKEEKSAEEVEEKKTAVKERSERKWGHPLRRACLR
ncbi:P-loop containing nucleoside triphosphate hydrolases superfamily protein [Actinidia rufa]|uniref:P-loop containing nucleoside triphosphate hydrolases superfamily protein n=1 Tax=Actinidia rufa TaxID=165716 RepID=A0A7J0EKW8_9ERIC|nr:P-loop containing nucleoside triphosphate hydrolases superfamily protein [Actinidia rufa]